MLTIPAAWKGLQTPTAARSLMSSFRMRADM